MRFSVESLETQTIVRMWGPSFREHLAAVVSEWIATPGWRPAAESDVVDSSGDLPALDSPDDDPDNPFPRSRGEMLVDDGADVPGLAALGGSGLQLVLGSVDGSSDAAEVVDTEGAG
jgi:hypothetical protein